MPLKALKWLNCKNVHDVAKKGNFKGTISKNYKLDTPLSYLMWYNRYDYLSSRL